MLPHYGGAHVLENTFKSEDAKISDELSSFHKNVHV